MTNTLDPWAARWLVERARRGELSRSSRTSMRARLGSFTAYYGDRDPAHLTPRHFRAWLERIGHMEPASRAAYYATVSQFVRWLHDENVVPVDATKGSCKPRVPRTPPVVLRAEDLEAVWNEALGTDDEILVVLLYGLGLRAMEAAGVRWEDWDEARGVLRVRGKGDKGRLVAVPSDVAEALRRHRTSRHGPAVPWVPATVSRRMTRLVWRAGVKSRPLDGIGGHAFRRTRATHLGRQTRDPHLVSQFLGHASVDTTMVYLADIGLDVQRQGLEGCPLRPGPEAA